MAERCAGCTKKYKFFEKPTICPECHRGFCQSCLPAPSKKSKDVRAVSTCVYCSRKQKDVNVSEDAEILEHFQERFYKHAHTEPPIQTRVQLDLSKVQDHDQRPAMKLSEEEKALEERLRKLKEKDKPTTPAYSEEEMRDRLAKLRDDSKPRPSEGQARPSEGQTRPSEGQARPSGKTEVEQSRDLIEQAADEVRMEERLAEMNRGKEEELYARFQALKGKKPADTARSDFKRSSSKLQDDSEIQDMLENMDIPELNEDPEKLLEDLKEFQVREQQSAMTEVLSSDVQGLVGKAKELAREECGPDDETHLTKQPTDLSHITYPALTDESELSKEEMTKIIREAVDEIKMDKQRQQEDKVFMDETSSRLARLRSKEAAPNDLENDEEVRSKLKPKDSLDFSWGHYGSGDHQPSTGLSAARQLGLTLSNEEEEEEGEFSDDVQALLKQMMAEADLDKKLEESGLDVTKKQDEGKGADEDKPHPSALGGGGACGYDGDLPWCCICNEDATIRCYDCDDDLYCTRCFSEGHEQFGLYDHKYASFQQPAAKR